MKLNKVYVVSNGDSREPANRGGWEKQSETLKQVIDALTHLGCEYELVPGYDAERGHGFISSQAQGAHVFADIDRDAPVIVVLNIWAYAHHVAGPLGTHQGPILVLANFDGTWAGLVGLLNHTATLDRMCIRHSRLWTETFAGDPEFLKRLRQWCETGTITYSAAHLSDGADLVLSDDARRLGENLAADILKNKRLMGQLDPGCMGMYNAVMSPAHLARIGMPLELLNQSDLLAEMELVSDTEAQNNLNWLVEQGVWFDWGEDDGEKLTTDQVLTQMKTYVAACRIYERYGLSAIGIPYQLGLVRCIPATDLVEGMLNNTDRPEVISLDTGQPIAPARPVVHFNEGDLGAGVPQVLMHDICQCKGMAPETTLHDVRWGRNYEGKFTWVFLISGGAPPAHWNGWNHTKVYRQPEMFFPKGGGTCQGVSKPGIVTWARFYQSFGAIGMDCGLGQVLDLPEAEVQERYRLTEYRWPVANTWIPGYGRDELMATHMSNHIVLVYGDILDEFVATCLNLGIPVRIAGNGHERLRCPGSVQ